MSHRGHLWVKFHQWSTGRTPERQVLCLLEPRRRNQIVLIVGETKEDRPFHFYF